MSRGIFTLLATFALAAMLSNANDLRAKAASGRPAVMGSQGAELGLDAQNRLIQNTCVRCHNDRGRAGGLSLAEFDAAEAPARAEVGERMIHKLRAGMMPPMTVANRPPSSTLDALAAALEARIDRAAARAPTPGRRTFQRLTRAEYRRAVRELLAIDVDVDIFLPPDTISDGFDNLADAQAFSPTLTEGYLRAADRVVGLALGDRHAEPSEVTYKVPRTKAQRDHVPGAPWGTRGGISVVHTFPADGEYTFRVMLHSVPSGRLYGSTARGEQIEVSINGERVALLDIDPQMSEAYENGMNLHTPPVHVAAGPQRVSAAFLQQFDSPIDDLLAPIEYTLADSQIGEFGWGVTTMPHLRDFSITGPFSVTGVSETPSRRTIFTCRPTSPADERRCAAAIVGRLARTAYRQPPDASALDPLMAFYDDGRQQGGFEAGIGLALRAMLISPRFLFRLEEVPAGARPGDPYRLNGAALASRLSFFLWGTGPDDRLVEASVKGRLGDPNVLAAEVRRMLADRRSEALSRRFAAQWLRLQDVDQIKPDALRFPSFDHVLAESFKRETELLFDSIVRDDRSVLDLLNADYTFVNERLARHYGIPGVAGEGFQRVPLDGALAHRRGVLGHGSMLMATSVANRTSPVLRGKWIMEVLLGSPPPPPPPNVPDLEETGSVGEGRLLSTRERLEQHRASPACASCHRVIDPLGLALENFDVTGAWRSKDNGVRIDASGELYDGTPLRGPEDLRQALLARSETFLRTLTRNLMTYALGRRIEYFDQPAVRATVRRAAAQNHRFSAYVLGIVESAAFQMSELGTARATEVAEVHTKQPYGARGASR